MVKSYFRYEPKQVFGVANSHQCNAQFSPSLCAVLVASNESIYFLNALSGEVIKTIEFGKTCRINHFRLKESEFGSVLAVGFEDGDIFIRHILQEGEEDIARRGTRLSRSMTPRSPP